MWTCSLEIVDDCAGRGMFSAPASYQDDDACLACIAAVGPAAESYDDFPATTSFEVTD